MRIKVWTVSFAFTSLLVSRDDMKGQIMNSHVRTLSRIAGAIGLSLALSLGAATAFADDDDPTAYLYEGTCAEFDNATVLDEIDDLDSDDDDLDEIWDRIGNGQDQPEGLLATEDDVDDVDSVQQVVDGEFFVAVHETEETSSAALVCGDLTGSVQDDTLLAPLAEVGGSGFEGRVMVHLDHDDSDEDVEFSVGIYPAGAVDPLSSPTPAG